MAQDVGVVCKSTFPGCIVENNVFLGSLNELEYCIGEVPVWRIGIWQEDFDVIVRGTSSSRYGQVPLID